MGSGVAKHRRRLRHVCSIRVEPKDLVFVHLWLKHQVRTVIIANKTPFSQSVVPYGTNLMRKVSGWCFASTKP